MRGTNFAETRLAELDRTGETVIRASTAKLGLFVILALAFTAVGLVLMIAPFVDTSTTWDHVAAAVIFGAVTVVFFGVIGIPALVLQMIQRRRLVLDRSEMRLERRRSGQWEAMDRFAWADIESVFGARVGRRWPYRGQLLITIVLAPDAYAESIAQHPTWKSGLQSINERIVGSRTHSLPNIFGWRTRPLLELVTAVHAKRA